MIDARRVPEGLLDEARTMLDLRWKLARLEIEQSRRALVRLGWCLAPCLALAGAVVPLLGVALSERLGGIAGLSKCGWLMVFALVLGLAAAGLGYAAWRRFRREFTGLEQTLQELREDLLWVREGIAAPTSASEETAL